MKILAIGHHYIVDQNRKFWFPLMAQKSIEVDFCFPVRWKSNLFSEYQAQEALPAENKTLIFSIPIHLSGNGSLYFYHPLKLHAVLQQKKYDWIYIAQEIWSISALQISIQKIFTSNRKTRIFLFSAQNIKKKKFIIFRPIEWIVSKFCDGFGYCCEDAKNVLKWKGVKGPFTFVPYSFDQDLFFPHISKHHPHKFDQQIIIGYMGRMSEEKGLKTLVDAIILLRQKGNNITLKLAGNGPLLDDIKKINFVKYIGLLPHQQANTFYSDIDLFILPSKTTSSWKEQFGRVITEAIAMGVPVIGSSSGAIPEVLERIGMPYIFQEGSVSSLTQKIHEFIEDVRNEKIEGIMKLAMEKNFRYHSNKSATQSLLHFFETKT